MKRPAILVWCDLFKMLCEVDGDEARSVMLFASQGYLDEPFTRTAYDLMLAGF